MYFSSIVKEICLDVLKYRYTFHLHILKGQQAIEDRLAIYNHNKMMIDDN